MNPIVLVEIDRDSRLRVLQTAGVAVVLTDWRVDPSATIWPQPDRDTFPDIMAAIGTLPLMSPGSDDEVRSALNAIRRIRAGLSIVTVPTLKIGETA